jgi:HEAT repeat protein
MVLALLFLVGVNIALPQKAQPEDLQAAFQKYCLFVKEDARSSNHRAVASTLDDQSKDILMEMAVADDASMKLCSWMLLAAASDTRIVPIISEYIADTSNEADGRSIACSWIKGFATVEALPAMLSALSEPLDHDVNASLHWCAIQALGSIDDDGARERLRELLVDPGYAWTRSTIIESLGRIRDTAAVPQLIAIALEVPGGRAENWAAMTALAAIGTPESIAPLLEAVESIPAGSTRFSVGLKVKNRLRAVRDGTDDPDFRAVLEQLIPAIQALAKEQPH